MLSHLSLQCVVCLKSCRVVWKRQCVISVFATSVDLANKNLQKLYSWQYSVQSGLDDRIRPKFKELLDGYQKMFDQSLSKSSDLGDMLKFLPGVVVQNDMSMQGMVNLYRIKSDLLECLIKSTMIKPLRPPYVSFTPGYRLDGYLSGFLQDRDRSQHYYSDPILQQISICRHILSLLDGSNVFQVNLQLQP